jgi:predicted lipoprotein with Yx(FWY)xxD motif
MRQTKQRRDPIGRVKVGLMAGAILAAGAVSASTVAVGTAGAATTTVISMTKNAKLGTILVSGKTVYTLKPSSTACSTACLKAWPAVLLPKGVKKAKAGTGVNAAKLGTVKLSNGTLQVTYAGKRLYKFVGDTATGQVHGNVTDTWGKWTAVVTAKPAGTSSGVAATTGSGSTATTSSGSGGSGGAGF